MKPIIILPPNAVSDECMNMLRENDLCVVVAEDPSKLKFLDPIPAASCRTEIESAAIALSRRVLAGELQGKYDKSAVAALYIDILLRGTTLDPDLADKEKHEREWFNTGYYEEVKEMGRQKAREEREKKKAAAASQSKK